MSLTALVAIVVLPAFLVFVLGLRYLVGRERRALLELARNFVCARCGTALGEQGVALADEHWERHMQKLLNETKGMPRIVRDLDGVCPKCGQRYQLDPDAKTFKLLA